LEHLTACNENFVMGPSHTIALFGLCPYSHRLPFRQIRVWISFFFFFCKRSLFRSFCPGKTVFEHHQEHHTTRSTQSNGWWVHYSVLSLGQKQMEMTYFLIPFSSIRVLCLIWRAKFLQLVARLVTARLPFNSLVLNNKILQNMKYLKHSPLLFTHLSLRNKFHLSPPEITISAANVEVLWVLFSDGPQVIKPGTPVVIQSARIRLPSIGVLVFFMVNSVSQYYCYFGDNADFS